MLELDKTYEQEYSFHTNNKEQNVFKSFYKTVGGGRRQMLLSYKIRSIW